MGVAIAVPGLAMLAWIQDFGQGRADLEMESLNPGGVHQVPPQNSSSRKFPAVHRNVTAFSCWQEARLKCRKPSLECATFSPEFGQARRWRNHPSSPGVKKHKPTVVLTEISPVRCNFQGTSVGLDHVSRSTLLLGVAGSGSGTVIIRALPFCNFFVSSTQFQQHPPISSIKKLFLDISLPEQPSEH